MYPCRPTAEVWVTPYHIWKRSGLISCFGPEPNFIKSSDLYAILADPAKHRGSYILMPEE